MKSSNPVEVISVLLYRQVTNEAVPLALFVTLAAQSSEVFYRALVPFRPSVIPNRPVDYPSICPAQRRLFYDKDEEHPKNLSNVTVRLELTKPRRWKPTRTFIGLCVAFFSSG